MKVVGLISGGKDSTFNMMKCIEHGHEIIALANLHPIPGFEELDSYMYQSVGHDLIESLAECMELPLYRHPISGKPVNVNFEYTPTIEDEVECLYELLKKVKDQHPDLEAVSSGAILSSYQKNRVENVCERLGLISLAYLWQADQPCLLQDMINSNLEAIIIKVAVYGLDDNDLGKRLEQIHPKLESLAERFGLNVCGEGGEFESLTLDCPLFKKRIIIDETKTILHKASGSASVFYLKILKWHLQPK